MAKASLWQRVRRAVTRIFNGGGGGGSSSRRRVVNNRDSRRVTSSNTSDRRAYINAFKGEKDDLKRDTVKDAWSQTKSAFKASSSKATSDPKEELRKSARANRKKETKDWFKATNNRYNVSGAKDKAEELKRRQNVKSRAFDAKTAVKEEKHELKYHPVAYSAARRAARGASLTGELIEKKGVKSEAKKAQKYFEKNQNKVAGGIGEAAGMMASFALTANPSKVAVKKALPKAVRVSAEKGGEKLAARLAGKKLIRKAAEKEVSNAVKKGLTKEVTKGAVDKVAKQKAKELVANLGEDFAQNITTGALNDISRASANHKVGSKGWRRELAASGAMNFGLGGAATVGLPAAGKGIKRALGGVSEGAEKALKGMARNSDDVKVSLNRRRNTSVRLKEEEPKVKADLGRKRKTDVRLPNEPNRWYHAGDLGKAEWHGNQAGSRRGTGHFGTGTYLAGTEDILKSEGYGSRPLWEVDASKYNTYRPKDRTQGLRVHDNLKKLNRESGDIDSFVKRARIKEEDLPNLAKALDDANNTKDLEEVAGKIFSKRDLEAIGEAAEERLKHWHENNVNPDYHADIDIDEELDEMLADADLSDLFFKGDDNDIDRILDEAAKRSAEKRASEVEVPLATYEQAYKTELSDAIGKAIDDLTEYGNETSNALRELGEDLGATPEQIDNALAKTQEVIDAYDRHQVFIKEDSASTIFMKALGYEGVDVSGIEGLDNTEIGSVIYDLRPEDARLIREGKPRKAIPPTVEASFPYEGTPEADALVRNQQSAPLTVDEMAGVDEAMPSTNPRQTAVNDAISDLERRAEQIAEEPPKQADDNIKVNNVTEESTVGGRPSGVKQVRSAYEYNNGEPIEDGILTSWNEAWKASQEYSASHATGNRNRQSKVAVSQLNAMDSDAERELRQRLADSGELNYDAIDTPELYDKIAKQMRDDADRWVKDMIDINQGGALDFRATPEWQARVQYIMGTVDPSADEASEIAYTEAFKLAQNISSKGGQTLNLRRNFVHLTPMGKRDAILDDLISILYKSKGFQKNHPKMRTLGRFDQRNYIRDILMQDEAINKGVDKVVNVGDPDAVSDAFTELMYRVNKQNPKAGFDVLQELRYLNMLGNPKTHIRNIFGSGFFIPMREASNSIRSLIEQPIEKWASQYGKFDVTRHGGLLTQTTPEAKSAADEAFKALKNEVLGSAKYETVSYKGRGKTAAGKVFDTLSDFNSTLLTKEDDAFRTRAFKNSYAKSYSRYLKDGKPITDKIKRKIEQEAIRESQIATFNEYNRFANFLNNISRKANDANASTGARWGGRALNAVMPFTKVPANLMNQSLNYSPLGLARGMANIKTAAKAGDSVALNAAIDQLASGMTGSAVFGLGMLLGKTTDMFTTNTGKNDPAAKFRKDRGMQNYSITFKDPETGKGYSFTLDWLVPTSATFFSGVEMANQLKSGDFNVLDIGGDWSNVVTRLAEPVMETSMLSGLHGMLETMRSGSKTDDDKGAIGILLRETVQSYMNSLIPTIAGQASRAAYKSDMQIVGDTDWEYWRNQAKSKAGLANTNILGEALGADTDAYGNVKGEKKNGADYAKSALKNFLSPANIQKVDFSKVDDEKLRTFEKAVKNGADPEEMAYLFPKKQYKKEFKVAGESVKMSNKDVSTYNQAKTKGGEEGMRYILENIMFNRQVVGADGKKTPADSAYTKEQKQALMNEFKGKSMREVEEWLYSQPEFKNATEAEKKKAINGLWTLDSAFNAKANASRRVGEQAVIKAQGGDVNEYNFKNEVSEKKREALEPLIEAGVVSYKEAVDFARNAGKTYYYEDEDGGHSAVYFNKKEMIQYLVDKGYSYEKAEALFNSFKASNAKPYSGNSLSSGKGRRRRRRGYRRRRGGGSSKTVATSVPIKASDFKADKATYKDAAASLQTRSSSKKKTKVKATPTVKVEPPKVKFKKYEV